MSENTERRYLKWYNKVGYGSGDVAGNVVYAFLSSFVMIYLTDTVGLNPGIVGTLIAVSKLFDGLTDIFFGSMIDKTHSKLGKARPWMLYGYIGCAITLVGIFAIPMGMSEFAKYAWFFICYSLLNAVFYTANNIAYSALTSLVTKNSAERVEMGSYRFMFAFATSLAIQSFTLLAVSALGDTAEAWRTVAIVYAIIGLIVNTLSVFSVKELPEEEFVDTTDKAEIEKDEKYGLVEAAKLLVSNKYYLMICVTYILQQIYGAMISMGTYYTAHILGDKNLFGVFSWAINIPLIIALVFTPTLVAKMHGMYKLNVGSYALATVARALVAVAGYTGSGDVKMMLLFTAIAALGQGPWQGDMNAVIASCSEYTWLTKHKRVDGTMYSCTSLGVKLGGGVPYYYHLTKEHNFLPNVKEIPDDVADKAKMMIVSLPANPVGSVGSPELYQEIVDFCNAHKILLVHDNAYSDIIFDGAVGHSIFNIPGAETCAVEFFSLSKSFNVTGARISFLVGRRDVIAACKKLRTQIDFGKFIPEQKAAIAAMTGPLEPIKAQCAEYQRRRDALCGGFRSIGWDVPDSHGSMFVWAPVPQGHGTSMEFCMEMIEKAGVICTPGSSFGPSGEGYVRFALTLPVEKITEAVQAVKNSGLIG